MTMSTTKERVYYACTGFFLNLSFWTNVTGKAGLRGRNS